ncbi:MAG: hypothetical protein ABIP36_00965 [Acidimicrobiales bacterium]
MTRLHIEHAITDLSTWLDAFNSFGQARRDAGMTAQQVHQPIDDDKYIVVDLDFASVEAANKFKEFLEQVIWQTPDMSPGLAGAPRARVLEEVDTAT